MTPAPTSPRRTAHRTAVRATLLALAATAGLAAACNDANDPLEIDTYPYKAVVPDGRGGFDTLAFRWEDEHLPLRVWAEDSHGLRELTETALARWDDALRNETFEATLVDDSSDAHIIVRFRQTAGEFNVLRLQAQARACRGEALIDIPAGNETVLIPIQISVFTGLDREDPDVQRCLDVTTTHEIGHAIGIFGHSPEPGDVMHDDPTAAVPTHRDVATVRTLYRGPSDLEPAEQ
jgi:hypothetical protein